jgi:hypothetical protein
LFAPADLPCSRVLLVQGNVYCLPCSAYIYIYIERERERERERVHHPLDSKMGTSPLSPGSVRSSKTFTKTTLCCTFFKLKVHEFCGTYDWENQQLVTDEPVELEK